MSFGELANFLRIRTQKWLVLSEKENNDLQESVERNSN